MNVFNGRKESVQKSQSDFSSSHQMIKKRQQEIALKYAKRWRKNVQDQNEKQLQNRSEPEIKALLNH